MFRSYQLLLNFLEGTLGVQSAPYWVVLRDCGHKLCNSFGFEQLQNSTKACCPPKVPLLSRSFILTSGFCLGLTCWALDILRAFERLQGYNTHTQSPLAGVPICYSDFTANPRFRMRKVWMDIADTPSEKRQLTYHSWFASPPLDLQADSRPRVR